MYRLLGVISGALLLAGCNQTISAEAKNSQTMVATWYQHGSRTANGEKFNPDGMTAAHRTLPFGTKLHLVHKDRTVVVRINDRGPFVKGRHLDLSRGSARVLGCLSLCTVNYRIVD